MLHALTVDVEDWYHDAGHEMPGAEVRVEANTDRLLAMFARHGTRATFFVLGEVAERHRSLVQRLAAAGHEIGSHGHRHRAVSQLTRREFREDVQRSIATIEDAAGVAVRGYRAPYFSIKAGVHWPVDVLRELGLRYDSSILPIDRPPGMDLVCPRVPFQHANGLWELPVATLRLPLRWHLPLASGGGLRFVPFRLLHRWVRRFERDVGAGVFYLHPWEIDPTSPIIPGSGRWLLRVGRRQLMQRLEALLGTLRFAPIADAFSHALGIPCHAPLA